MEWLRELLKAQGLTEEQINKIVDGVSGTIPTYYVPKDKYNSKADEVKTLNAQLVERDKQLSEIKKSAGEGEEKLKAKIELLESDNKTAKEAAENAIKEAEQKFNQQALDMLVSNEIVKSKGKNEKAIKALLDMELVKLEDGKLKGLEEQIKNIKAKDGYLFDDGDGGTGGDGGTPGANPPTGFTGKDFGLLTTEERLAFKQKDPAKYELQRQAWLLNSAKR